MSPPSHFGGVDSPVFTERLPSGPPDESPAETDSRVRLDLEIHAPLPVDRLAYGWVRLVSGDVLYYAMPVERVPPHAEDVPAGRLIPDPARLLLPEGVSPGDLDGSTGGIYADLRPRDVLARRVSRAAADKILSRTVWPMRIGVGVAAVLLLVSLGMSAHTAWRDRRLEGEAERIREAEARADALFTLERLSGSGRSVFDLLAVVNVHRPESVAFSRVTFEDNRELVIEGRAGGVADINRWGDALRTTGHFGVVETPKLDTSRGRSTFRMRLTVTRWPKIADAPSAAPSGHPSSPAA